MMTSDCDGKSAFSEGLTTNMVKNWRVFICFCIFYNNFGMFLDGLFML